MEGKASSRTTTARIGYIRTTSHPDKNKDEIYRLLLSYARQTRPSDALNGFRRHIFIFGAATDADSHILSLLTKKFSESIKQNVFEHLTLAANDNRETGFFNYIEKEDLIVHMSKTRAETTAGQQTLRCCQRNGIRTVLCGTTDEQCDEIMLEESTYLIDFHTIEHSRRARWFLRYARIGQPEDNELTNPKYEKEDASKTRLQMRYAGYGWKASSGGYHGNGPWRCRVCGGQCKRNCCRNGGSVKREEELRAYNERELEWTKEWASMPGKRDERWKDLTADSLCWRYSLRHRLDGKERREWTSIDTFSGE